jgi:hypothetical protein
MRNDLCLFRIVAQDGHEVSGKAHEDPWTPKLPEPEGGIAPPAGTADVLGEYWLKTRALL